MYDLREFVRESNRIEGIGRDPAWQEIDAHERLLATRPLMIQDLERFVSVCEPRAKLRTEVGMDVFVGDYTPPPGGPGILRDLTELLAFINDHGGYEAAWQAHMRYETLHPFMDGNGRSGRAVWLWMIGGGAPLGFLHAFYYHTLSCAKINPVGT